MSYVGYMSYVSYMRLVSYMSYVNYMSYVGKLFELYELCKLYEYFMNCLKIAWNHLNSVKITWNIIFLEFFYEYIKIENLNYKSKNLERKYLNNMWNNQLVKVKINLLELGNNYIQLKDGALKDREINIKREIE